MALEWSSEKLKVLGVFVGPGDLESANWRPRLDAVANVLASWRQRSLSYGGRALVVNTLASSHFWYVASLVPVPDWVYAEVLKLIFNFFLGWQAGSCGPSGCCPASVRGWLLYHGPPPQSLFTSSYSGCGDWLFPQTPGFVSSGTGVLSVWAFP